jgi:hypothetical protein
MSICGICLQDITAEQKKIESTCGCHYHTDCGIDYLRRYFLHDWPDVNLTCSVCNAVLFTAPQQHQQDVHTHTPDITVHARMQQADFKADLKKYKQRLRESGTKLRLLNEALRQHHIGYSNTVRIHIAAIREAKSESITAFKHSQEYMEYTRAMRSTNSTLTRFVNKYNLGRDELRILFPRRRTWRGRWRTNPQYIIRRKYRVKL